MCEVAPRLIDQRQERARAEQGRIARHEALQDLRVVAQAQHANDLKLGIAHDRAEGQHQALRTRRNRLDLRNVRQAVAHRGCEVVVFGLVVADVRVIGIGHVAPVAVEQPVRSDEDRVAQRAAFEQLLDLELVCALGARVGRAATKSAPRPRLVRRYARCPNSWR